MKKAALIAAVGALAVAVPAAAKPGPGHPSHPTTSHKCVAHKVAYVAYGTLVSSSLTKNSDGTYTGTVTVHVTRTDNHGKSDKGMDVTYTLSNAKVKFGHGVDTTTPAAGSRVKVIGKITTLAKKCSTTGFTPMVTVSKVVIHAAKS